MTCEKTNRYFTAAEICVNKVDGTKGFAVGSLNGSETCTGLDYENLNQVKGLENRDTDKDMFAARVSNFHLDLNENDAYDVYDLAHFMAGYAPSTKDAKVSGKLEVVPEHANVKAGDIHANVKAGDIITVNVTAKDIENANALGALIHFDDSKFEYVTSSLKASSVVSGMKDYSVAKTTYKDGVQSINIALVNEGDKDLYSGNDVIAGFQLKAKADMDKVELDSSTWTMGALLDFTEGGNAALVDRSELQSVLDAIKAENLVAEEYTEASWQALTLAIEDAERLLDPASDTTQETIDQCVKALKDAREALVKSSETQPSSLENLGALIEQAEGIDVSGKTEASVEIFQVALKLAKDVYANEEATDEQIASAYNELCAAIDGLEDQAAVDAARKDLEQLVNKAEKADLSNKTQESANALKDALAAAKNILAKKDATAAELKDVYAQLDAALKGLKVQQNVPGVVKPEGNMPQTGDTSLVAIAGTAAAGFIAAIAGVFMHRKNRA